MDADCCDTCDGEAIGIRWGHVLVDVPLDEEGAADIVVRSAHFLNGG